MIDKELKDKCLKILEQIEDQIQPWCVLAVMSKKRVRQDNGIGQMYSYHDEAQGGIILDFIKNTLTADADMTDVSCGLRDSYLEYKNTEYSLSDIQSKEIESLRLMGYDRILIYCYDLDTTSKKGRDFKIYMTMPGKYKRKFENSKGYRSDMSSVPAADLWC